MMKTQLPNLKLLLSLMTFMVFSVSCSSDDDNSSNNDEETNCENTASIFDINLNANDCNVDIEAELLINSQYNESVSGSVRTITINGIANHLVGEFPNAGNPNTIAEASETFTMTTEPSVASSITNGQGHTFGVLFSGVAVDPYTAEFFQGSGGVNMQWNITTLQNERDLGLDCNNAHVQPTGRYHYHGLPIRYAFEEGIDGSQMVKVGYAGDGFSIYYKYGYDDDGTTLIELESGYRLKTEERSGDGVTAPNGCPNGLYFQDYEYVEGISELDACNGRFGKTPEAENEYYYVITDNFPSSPLCFSGTPDNSFRFN